MHRSLLDNARATSQHPSRMVPPAERTNVRIEPISMAHMDAFLAAVRRSRKLHGRWVAPPSHEVAFRNYVRARTGPVSFGFLVISDAGELIGAINLNEIVRGLFQNAFLGYYAFAPHARRGYMSQGLAAVIELAFREQRLHRLEANIQPGNAPSIALVKRAGFRLEGFSPRYLKIAGRWRDHERWALTREDWTRKRKPSRTRERG
jgi:ribosomal-protein-alanine N-acetyltransferase